MANEPKYTLTNESVTIFFEDKMYTVQKNAANFLPLVKAIINQEWDKIKSNLTVVKSIKEWAKGFFTMNDEGTRFLYKDGEIPEAINQRIIKMATNGEDPTSLMNFWERLSKNPSWRSVQQLYPFLSHVGIPITPDGCFLAYKGVNTDYTDKHTSTIDNSPGSKHEMPRNKISDDPNQACHYGFHVGDESYAKSFGNKTVVCKIDPEHVVCVPYDESQRKMRICKYEVIGNYGCLLPSTTYSEEHEAKPDKDIPPEETDYYEDDPYGDDEDYSEETDEEQEEVVADPAPVIPPEITTPNEDGEKHSGAEAIKKVPSKYKKYQTKNIQQLMELSISELRDYATHGLFIVGASKIPGGKAALVSRILELHK